MTLDMFVKGALLWIPQNTRRWVEDPNQIQLFPHTLSVTRQPMLGVFKGYNFSGTCEVLCPDGVWSFEQNDVKPYNGIKGVN